MGKKRDLPSWGQTTILTWSSSSCFTSSWGWITTICNTVYYSKMASVSGIFSTSGCNAWQFCCCCCMEGWAVPAKSGGIHSNCLKISWTPGKASSALSQKVMVKHLPAQIHKSPKWLGKKSEIYIDKQRKISNDHDQSYQVCTCPRWQKAQTICVTGKRYF